MANAIITKTLQRAIEHHEANRLPQAEALYREILARDPRCSDALHLLGVIAGQVGRHELAVDLIGQAVKLAPERALFHANLGETYRGLARLDEAVASLRRALALQPDFPAALTSLGVALAAQHRTEEAQVCFQRALALRPNAAETHNHLGNVYKEQGLFGQAIACYRQAIALRPNFTDAYNELGNCLRVQRKFAEALVAYQQALALNPEVAEIHYNLGGVFTELGQLDAGLASCQRALALNPGLTEAHVNLGVVYKERGQLDEALACYRRAIELKPVSAEWHDNLILALYYRSGHDAKVIDAELHHWNQQHGQRRAVIPRYSNDPAPDRRLRIGYLSPDFRSHPVGRFLLPLFTHHSRQSFEIFCYSNTQPIDQLTAWFRSSADGWREIASRTNQQAADLIREDRIDILVDLALHTAKSRLPILAFKPAPVQATYLAYPGNSGLDTVDFRITDAYLDPLDDRASDGNERPIRVQGTYWCYQPPDGGSLDAGPLPALAAGRITFGCFNNFCKVAPEALAAWCRLLQSVPDARLRLHVRPGSHRSRVLDFFAAHAVSPERLDLLGFVPEAEYFQSYRSIDIALDPFPFPGGTTTCDALWMGVPVISLAGPTPVTRGGLSILSNVGLPELVADSVNDYVAKATALACDLPRLVALRAGLRERMQRSPLMDAPGFTRGIEAAYRTMWLQWCARQDAATGSVPPST